MKNKQDKVIGTSSNNKGSELTYLKKVDFNEQTDKGFLFLIKSRERLNKIRKGDEKNRNNVF